MTLWTRVVRLLRTIVASKVAEMQSRLVSPAGDRQFRYRLLIFPGAWCIAYALGCVGAPPSNWLIICAVGLLGFCFNEARDERIAPRFVNARRLFIALGIVTTSFVASGLYDMAAWDPIGVGADDGWGDTWVTHDELIKSSRDRKFVTIRGATCPVSIHSIYSAYFVFLHDRFEPPSRQNLVFRYWAFAESANDSPRVKWVGDSTLLIIGPNNGIQQASKQLSTFDGINIHYNLSKPAYPAMTFWERPGL